MDPNRIVPVTLRMPLSMRDALKLVADRGGLTQNAFVLSQLGPKLRDEMRDIKDQKKIYTPK